MNSLVNNGIVEQYAPLMDVKGSYSAQFEHVSMLLYCDEEPELTLFCRLYCCESRARR